VAAVTLGMAGFGTLIVSPSPASAAAPAQGTASVVAPLPGDKAASPNFYSASATCPAVGQCVMVGSYYDTSSKPWGLIETQSGTTWTDTQAPEPLGAGSGSFQEAYLGDQCGFATTCSAVSCPSPGSCVAVGFYKDASGHFFAMIDTLANNSWTSVQAPEPTSNRGTGSDQLANLYSVSCLSSTSCIAVGHYENTAGREQALIDVLSGTQWTAVEAPVPGDAGTATKQFSSLTELSCASATSCVAVGQYQDGSGFSNGFIETLSGTSWSAITTPLPGNSGTDGDANLNAQPFAVACPSASSCQLVGAYNTHTAAVYPFIDTLSGTQWTSTPITLPHDANSSAPNSRLEDLSCPTVTMCVGVGSYQNGAARNEGLVATLTGTTWSMATGPLPNDADGGSNLFGLLAHVDCPTSTWCLASGSYRPKSSANGVAMLSTFSGGQWAAVPTPLPSDAAGGGAAFSQGISVACASPVACAMSGTYENDPGATSQGFLDAYTGPQGYWLAASDGGIFTFGNLAFYGSTGGIVLNKPIVGMASTPDGQGYWLVASDGGIFAFGDAVFWGSVPGVLKAGQVLNRPIVGMASTPDGKGYWVVASDGGIFTFGDAVFHGSTGAIALNKPIVGMAATPDGMGYWLVASDGGIFTEGDAQFYGSTGALRLNKPIVGMAADPNGDGYWLVASDGGIFTFGGAVFYGSTGNIVLNKPIVGMASTPSGHGYWLVATDGGVFSEGDALFYGSTGALTLNKPIVGMATG
jgi:hypothetical protein